MNFRIPYFYPEWNPGNQIVNLGRGGPASHMQHLAQQPRITPSVYAVPLMGMAMIPPRQVFGPTQARTANNYSNPLVFNNLEIAGIMKNPRGG